MCMFLFFLHLFWYKRQENENFYIFHKKYVNLGATLMDKTRKTLEIYIESSNFIFETTYRWYSFIVLCHYKLLGIYNF